jgi:hypothetical protein
VVADVVVAIHQPNFLPWLGFFDKMASCDVFVLLDDVQFSRGTRTNRVQVLVDGRAHWLTVPTRRDTRPLICDTRIDDSRPWREKAIRTLRTSYKGRVGFEETIALIEPVIRMSTERMADLNERGIRTLADALGIRPRVVKSSAIAVEGASSDRLARLVDAVGGTVYLSGSGGRDYLAEEPFRQRGIEVKMQRFVEPNYPQATAEPVRGLSAIDGMMSVGIDELARSLAERRNVSASVTLKHAD